MSCPTSIADIPCYARRSGLILLLLLLLAACSDRAPEQHDEHAEPGEHGGEPHAGEPGEPHEEGVIELSPAMLERAGLRTAPVALRALAPELSTTGQVDFEQDRVAHVTPRIPGRVERVHAGLGESIRKGQVLAVIDSIELGKARGEYLQAQAQEELARQNYEREQGLHAERISSEKEMLAARAAHLEALARLKSDAETLRLYGLDAQQIEQLGQADGSASLLAVRSPLAGRVVEKHVTVGELVTPERNLFTIADLGHVWVWIDVYEQHLGNVHLEDDVTVAVDAYSSQTFSGKVSYLSDQVAADTRTVRARIDVENPKHELRPGMFARVTLSDPHFEPANAAPAVVVPAGAIQRDGASFVVFVPLGANRYERREVRVGRRTEGFAEILAGLEPTDTVVIEGAFLLKSEASKAEMGAGHAH